MSEIFNSLTIPFLLAMFLAVTMGGSGTAPAFSAAYGANVIKRTMIPGLFGIMVLTGALIAGSEVSLTLGKGLLEQSFFTPFNTSIILLSIALSLLFANLLGVPQSASQSTVLAIAGAATALEGLNFHKLFFEIIPTWIILPIISFFIMLFLSKWIFPLIKNKVLSQDYSHLNEHKGLKALLILSSLYVAFSIGANNVANAAAPIASLTANEIGQDSIQNFLPIIILSVLIVAPCFAIGSSLLGHQVTKTTGKEIVEITPFYATIIAVIVASLILLASVTRGIPTSLVQLNGAAFIALSVSKHGFKPTFSNKTVKRFFVIWGVAPIFSFLLTLLLIWLFK
ncbi:anion permease [Mariniflexile sp.]|uniref:inorganic phosphate transporter n=1 Tax=Mariniflexile sp. TaxID=1979402 RepID=UPI00356B2E33